MQLLRACSPRLARGVGKYSVSSRRSDCTKVGHDVIILVLEFRVFTRLNLLKKTVNTSVSKLNLWKDSGCILKEFAFSWIYVTIRI